MTRLPLKQIAGLAGVSKMTVSRALREGTSVRPEVRSRIREIARCMGYQRDARISEVMSAIRRSQSPTYRENIAFVWTHRGSTRKSNSFFEREFEGAQRQAREMGYKVEEFRLKDDSLNGRNLTRILLSRGIRGVLIAPPRFDGPHPHVWLDWKELCCVIIGRSLANTGLPRVLHDHYAGTALGIRKLKRMGCSRIGLVLSESMDARSLRLVRSAFLGFHPASLSSAGPLIFTRNRYNPKELSQWVEENRPDALLTNFEDAFPTPEQVLAHFPARESIVALNWSREYPEIAGISQNGSRIGEQALTLLATRLMNGQYGLDPLAPAVLIPGSWKEANQI
ncbi:MAG TPA: LacI family DNA-binding transcriptional regulator [Chthoniobacteraceae bacterium]|nr:LacI family DNA-binding transcriptional regulator [Chthoniobacteraceae bacterium]